MRIRSMTAMTVRLPLSKPLKLSDMTIMTADNLLVRVADGDGHVGWGEAASAPTMTGETAEGMLAAVNYMVPQLVGREVEDLAAFGSDLDGLMYGNSGAKSAIDMALYDLAGKRAGVPVFELLGGAVRRKLPVLWMLAASDSAADVSAPPISSGRTRSGRSSRGPSKSRSSGSAVPSWGRPIGTTVPSPPAASRTRIDAAISARRSATRSSNRNDGW